MEENFPKRENIFTKICLEQSLLIRVTNHHQCAPFNTSLKNKIEFLA